MRRLFTFGCSFTTHTWPTWAAIMSYDTGFETYNYALPGLGNFGIANRMLEADLKHNFTDDDIICVLWSSWDREDRILVNDNWVGRGSFYFNPAYGYDFLKKTYNETHSVVQNSYSIITANKMYGDKISWQSSWAGWFENDDGAKKLSTNEKIKNLYLKKLPAVSKWDIDLKNAYGFIPDPHPEILQHFRLLEREIYPKLGLNFDSRTKNTCINIVRHIYNLKRNCNYIYYQEEIDKIIKEKFPKMYQAMKVVGPCLTENIDA